MDAAEKAFQEALQYAAHDGERQNIERQLMTLYRRQGKLEEILKEAEAKGALTFEMQMEQARNYSSQGKLDEAVSAYKKALEMTTRDWERENAERQLMRLYRRQGTLEEVLKEAEKNDTLTFAMQAELARHYRNKGKSEKAISAYKQALNMTTQSYERRNITIELLQEYVQIGENDLAIELYESASQSDSSSTSITSQGSSGFIVMLSGDRERDSLIKAFKNHRNLVELKTLFEKKLEENANNPAALEMIAEIYRNKNQHEKAAAAYQALCQAQPSNVRGFYYAAAAFSKNGQPELANDLLKQGETALSSSSKKGDMWFLIALGSICFESEMYTPAIPFFKDAVVLSGSRSYGGGSNWGQEILYEMLGKSYRATAQYEEAIKAYQRMANVSRSPNRKKEAEKAIKEIHSEGNLYETRIPKQLKKLEDNPDDINTRLALAENYESSDKVDEAIAQYEKISELQPDNAQWHKTLGKLYEKSPQIDKTARLAKATAAYEKAIELEPTSYQHYSLLAQTFVKGDQLSEAEAVYRRALDASLEEHEYNSMLRGLWKLYADKDQKDRGIAILEELKPKMPKSAVLLELLGDAYKEADDAEKADAAYAEWLAIRQKEANREQRGWGYHRLAEQLLNKDLMPELALELAERALQMGDSGYYASTLGHAYVANDRYEEALEQFKLSMNNPDRFYFASGNMMKDSWSRVAQAGKNAKDEDRYVEMVNKLKDATPDNPTAELHANVTLARFYRERDLLEKADAYMSKTAFIDEKAWWIIGPFDNAAGIGYNEVYVPENATQIDTAIQYNGIDGQVNWEKQADDTFDGFVDLQNIFAKNVNWNTTYAWTTVNSPDERKVDLRFGSGTQAKIWLNGEEVFTHSNSHSLAMDQDSIPVTLKQGENSILVKVCSEGAYFLGFYLRITDIDGKPFDDLKIIDIAK